MLPAFVLPARDLVARRGADAGAGPARRDRCRPCRPCGCRSPTRLQEELTRELASQIVAVTALNLRTIPQRLGSSAGGHRRHRRRGGGARRRAVDRGGLPRGDAGLGARRRAHRHAQRRRQRDDQRPLRRSARMIMRRAGHRARRRTARSPRAELFVDHRPPQEVDAARAPTCRCAASSRRRCTVRHEVSDRRGTDVRARHQRNRRRPRAPRRQFAGLDVGSTTHCGPEHVAGRRHLRGGRQRGGNGDLVRRARAAGRLSPRQQLPVGARAASTRADAFDSVQRLAHVQPAVSTCRSGARPSTTRPSPRR